MSPAAWDCMPACCIPADVCDGKGSQVVNVTGPRLLSRQDSCPSLPGRFQTDEKFTARIFYVGAVLLHRRR